MAFSLKKNVKSVIPVPIVVGSQPYENGDMPRLRHLMRIPAEGYKVDKYLDRLREAGTGVPEGPAREEAKDRAYLAVWSEVVEGVDPNDYEDLRGASRDEVLAFFAGERMPEDTSAEDRELYRKALLVHVREAVQEWLGRLHAAPLFR
jgi:hypothetical protein